jgi:hypothetical protein
LVVVVAGLAADFDDEEDPTVVARAWAVDAWPELTDAILTELSGR